MRTMIFGIALAAMAALQPSASVAAETLRGSHFACLTEPALDEVLTAVGKDDMRQVDAILDERRCIVLGDGQEFSVVDRGWRVSKIRAYAGNSSVLLFVTSGTLGDVR